MFHLECDACIVLHPTNKTHFPPLCNYLFIYLQTRGWRFCFSRLSCLSVFLFAPDVAICDKVKVSRFSPLPRFLFCFSLLAVEACIGWMYCFFIFQTVSFICPMAIFNPASLDILSVFTSLDQTLFARFQVQKHDHDCHKAFD